MAVCESPELSGTISDAHVVCELYGDTSDAGDGPRA